MPGGDRTGPIGRGPMTGRATGFCAGSPNPGYITPGAGRGFGQGWKQGSGRGNWGRRAFWRRPQYQDPYYAPVQGSDPSQNKEEEKAYLEEMVKGLEEEMKDIRERIKTLSEEK